MAAAGNASVIDLTHPINASTPTFSDNGKMRYEKLTSVEGHGYFSGEITLPEHFGTHIDAPAHFVSGKDTVDKISPSRLILPAVVIDVREEVNQNPDYVLTVEKIQACERIGQIPDGTLVLLCTGWSSRYFDQNAYRNPDSSNIMHFPGYGLDAVKYLIDKKHAFGLGIDTLSADCGTSKDFPVHSYALSKDVYLIENLHNLEKLPLRGALVFCGPLMIEGGSGSPARVLAILQQDSHL